MKDSNDSSKHKAMEKKFNELLTQPEEYVPRFNKAYYGKIHHCELCGSALTYSFKLEHESDSDFTRGKSLMVGSECIVNFANIYVPDGIFQLVEKLSAAKDCAKSEKFMEENKGLGDLIQSFSEKIMVLSREDYYLKQINEINDFFKLKRKYQNKKYLSEPEVQKCKNLFSNISKYEEYINESKSVKNQNLLNSDDKDCPLYQKLVEMSSQVGHLAYYVNEKSRKMSILRKITLIEFGERVLEKRLKESKKRLKKKAA